jgi:hypothetical protein
VGHTVPLADQMKPRLFDEEIHHQDMRNWCGQKTEEASVEREAWFAIDILTWQQMVCLMAYFLCKLWLSPHLVIVLFLKMRSKIPWAA